jgi:Spy/CpxP family protein refolding chaperone
MKIRLPIRASVALLNALFLISLGAQAQPNPDNPDRPRPPRGQPSQFDRPEARGQFGPGVPPIERVLTEEQRESMRSIMASQRDEMRGIQEKMRVARKELLKVSLAEKFDEDLVRSKALAVAKLEADLTVMRAKAMSQVQPPLSEEQIEQIMNAPQDRMQPGAGGPRPNERRGDRPPRGREGNDEPRPARPEPQ